MTSPHAYIVNDRCTPLITFEARGPYSFRIRIRAWEEVDCNPRSTDPISWTAKKKTQDIA